LQDLADKKRGLKAMEVLMFDGKPFTSDYKIFRNEVGKLKADGGGDIPESSMEGLQEAAKLPFQKDVTKIMILVTDAPPKGLPGVTGGNVPKTGLPLPTIAAISKHSLILLTKKAFQDIKLNQLHLIVRNEDKSIYELVQKGAPGKFTIWQRTAKSKKGFADFLPVLSKDIATTTSKADAVVATAKQPMPPESKGRRICRWSPRRRRRNRRCPIRRR